MTCYSPSSQGAHDPVLGGWGGARRQAPVHLSELPPHKQSLGVGCVPGPGLGRGGWAKANHAEAMGQKNELGFLVIDLVSDLAPDILCAV